MKTTNYRKMVMMLGGALIATVAAGCYGGGSGYSDNPYGYNSGYRSGYSYPQTYGNSYNAGYQNGVRADANRDRREDRVSDQHAVTVDHDRAVHTDTTHSVDRDKVSLKDTGSANHVEKN
jgi:hypothetical protein